MLYAGTWGILHIKLPALKWTTEGPKFQKLRFKVEI